MKNIVIASLVIGLFVGCEDENKSVHNQGKNCLECHSFQSAASIFTTLHAASGTNENSAKSYTIQLLLDTGDKILYRSARGDGNVRWSGDSGKIDNFTAQVLDPSGKVVNSSKTNSHNVGRLACNSCHTAQGLNGAPGRIVNNTQSLSSSLKNLIQ